MTAIKAYDTLRHIRVCYRLEGRFQYLFSK